MHRRDSWRKQILEVQFRKKEIEESHFKAVALAQGDLERMHHQL